MGELFEKGNSRPATEQDLELYEQARTLQSRQETPILQRINGPHEYLFLALFDGTGQDAGNPSQLKTNVGLLYDQAKRLANDPMERVGYAYVEGIGTQNHPLKRAIDGLSPYTWDDKIERAYRELATQAKEWKEQDPDASVRVAGVGYSRGAVLSAGLARLVDQYGIADPEELHFGRDARGNIAVESPRPPLVPPGQTAQAVGLFDPVATGMPANYDARMPPSVISGYSMLAANEQRVVFPHQSIIDAELSPDHRFLRVPVPGGHSNVGGGNREQGLETLAFNSMADYLNGLRDRPLFEYRPLPADRAVYSVYQARGVTAVPGLDGDGVRNLREELANCRIVDPCRDAEVVDETLARRFEYRRLQPAATIPALSALQHDHVRDAQPPAGRAGILPPSDPAHPDHSMLQQIRSGVRGIDQHAGKDYDDASERLSRSLLAASKDSRNLYPGQDVPLSTNALARVDHVVMGKDGRHAFAVGGDLGNPARRWATVDVAQAILTPVEQSDMKLEVANRQIADELQRARQQDMQRQQSLQPAGATAMQMHL